MQQKLDLTYMEDGSIAVECVSEKDVQMATIMLSEKSLEQIH